MQNSRLHILLFAILPLILSAFTHLWNPVGIRLHIDESWYLGRAMYTLIHLNPQAEQGRYDHPYFGQLFLSGIFKMIDYPNLLNPKAGDVHSIEMLYLVPRLLMGLLAVLDTFLIYKIAERRYNRNVAFIASILFAVMPFSFIVRRIFLESILLPFLLSSILFAVYYNTKDTTKSNINHNSRKNILLILFSGVFLGIAIFTKIPAFTMIPLVGFLIYRNDNYDRKELKTNRLSSLLRFAHNNHNLKMLAVWFIPVILIPLIWPAFAFLEGHFDKWLEGVSWQATGRADKPLLNSLFDFFKVDPVLFVIGMTGLVFAVVIKRDLFILFWAMPFLIFLYLIGFVSDFHLILLLPILCIASAKLIMDLLDRISNKRKITVHRILPFAIISAIGLFGLMQTIQIISVNDTGAFFKVAAFVAKKLPDNINSNNDVTLLLSHRYLWIPLYVFNKEHLYVHEDVVKGTKSTIFLVDRTFLDKMLGDGKQAKRFQSLYDNSIIIAKKEKPHVEIRITEDLNDSRNIAGNLIQ